MQIAHLVIKNANKKVIKNFITCILGLFFTAGLAQAQNNSIRGFIYEEESGEPVIFTNVILKGTSIGAGTDVNGYFSITKIPAGTYTIEVSYLGFETYTEEVTVTKNQLLNKRIFLKKSNLQLAEFEVSGEKQEARTQVKMSVVKVTPKEMKQLPSVGGEPDLAQYLQVIPGVIFTGDQGGQLYIRGGTPIQNRVLLDRMTIHSPFHSIGLFSVFETEIIRNADIYTGGFNAQFGERVSSIMDITTRDGNRSRLAGKVGASPFAAKAILEGPLKRAKDANDNSSSFIFTAKHSYLDQVAPVLYPYVEQGLPFSFTDLYGKISLNASNGSKVNFFGFNFNDRAGFADVSDLGWTNSGFGSSFVLVPSSTPALLEGHFTYSSYNIQIDEALLEPRTSGIDEFNFGLNFKYFYGDNELKYGVDITGNSTTLSVFNEVGREINLNANNTQLAGWVVYKGVFNRWVIEPSLRLQYYASLSEFSPEPRLGAKFNASENTRLKFATGMYSQNLISTISDRDIVNLFQGFITAPDNLQEFFTDQNGDRRRVTSALQTANHFIIGVEHDLNRRVTLNLEGYYKDFTQLTNLNRNKIFDDTPENFERNELLRKDFIVETGGAAGVDFTAKYEGKKIYFWATYSLGYNTRWDGIQEYPPIFDRRHNINLVGTYTWGEKKEWEFSARWNFGTGFPFTQTRGFFEELTFQGGLGQNIIGENGQLGIIFGELNGGRLPTYHRLDLNLRRNFTFAKNRTLEVNGGVTNVYNRENIFFVDRVTLERVDQLPLIPTIGALFSF
ncbi:MAG: TonB-dependent receptor [Luteibaculaceae bacterium]